MHIFIIKTSPGLMKPRNLEQSSIATSPFLKTGNSATEGVGFFFLQPTLTLKVSNNHLFIYLRSFKCIY